MRVVLLSAIVATTSLRWCGAEESDAPPPPPVSAAATVEVEMAPELRAPRYGGEVVVVQDHAVEVVPAANGEVYAYVATADGTVPPPDDIQLTVHVHVEQGGVRPVPLVWDPAHRRYRGRVRGAVLAPGPVDVLLVAHGRPRRGRARHVVVVPRAEVAVIAPGPPPGAKVWLHVPPGHARGRVHVPPGHLKAKRVGPPPGHAKGKRKRHRRGRGHGPPPPRAGAHAEVRVRAPEPPPPPRVEAGVRVEAGARVGN
jgi:hypothetical protein